MIRATVAAVLAAITCGAAAGAAAPAGSELSGVEGVVSISHGCPGPVRVGQPRCAHPAADVVVRVYRGGRSIRSGRTDTQGRFAFPLAAGRYVLRVELSRERSALFTVKAGAWTKLSLYYLIPPYMA